MELLATAANQRDDPGSGTIRADSLHVHRLAEQPSQEGAPFAGSNFLGHWEREIPVYAVRLEVAARLQANGPVDSIAGETIGHAGDGIAQDAMQRLVLHLLHIVLGQLVRLLEKVFFRSSGVRGISGTKPTYRS